MSAHESQRAPIGRALITPAAALHCRRPASSGARPAWPRGSGELPVRDLAANELALLTCKRLLSSYALPGDEKVWVIAEADRSSTTIFLPDEY